MMQRSCEQKASLIGLPAARAGFAPMMPASAAAPFSTVRRRMVMPSQAMVFGSQQLINRRLAPAGGELNASALVPTRRVAGPFDHAVGVAAEVVDGRAVLGREMEIEDIDILRRMLAPPSFRDG